LAAFQAQLYIFKKVEKTKANLRYSLIEEQFHGCIQTRIKGACAQLIEGSGAFRLLYDVREGENDVELVLKPSCCGKETLSSFVDGVHFTEDDIRTFGRNNKVNGRALWAMGLTVLRSIKKALSIVPKLSPRIVMIGKNCAVIGYASGKNEHSFMQLVDNGIICDDELIVDVSNGSDDDNERIGAVAEDEASMSVTRQRDRCVGVVVGSVTYSKRRLAGATYHHRERRTPSRSPTESGGVEDIFSQVDRPTGKTVN
jgi:hypothetical protein